MALDELIAKIQKLRRLATNHAATEHEAAAAAAAADKLIQEHGLHEAQLEAEGEIGEKPEQDSEAFAKWNGSVPQWQISLAIKLIRHYNCACYRKPGLRGQSATLLCVIGRPSDISTARYMYAWLTLEIERLAKQHAGNGKSWLNSYKHGVVNGVIGKMYESKKAARKATTTQSTGLAIFDRRLAEANEAMRRLNPHLSSFKTGGARDFGGFAQAMIYEVWQDGETYEQEPAICNYEQFLSEKWEVGASPLTVRVDLKWSLWSAHRDTWEEYAPETLRHLDALGEEGAALTIYTAPKKEIRYGSAHVRFEAKTNTLHARVVFATEWDEFESLADTFNVSEDEHARERLREALPAHSVGGDGAFGVVLEEDVSVPAGEEQTEALLRAIDAVEDRLLKEDEESWKSIETSMKEAS